MPYLSLEMGDEGSFQDYSSYNEKSKLSLYGYSVNRIDNYTNKQRTELLKNLIDMGLMSKAEIMNHLEWLIRTRNNPKNQVAIRKWQHDLAFVNNYQMNSQRIIWAPMQFGR